MIVEKLFTLKVLIAKWGKTGSPVASVWLCMDKMTGKWLFEVFILGQHCDIYDSPYVSRSSMIFDGREWFGDYSYLNGVTHD